jgi:hypothetical protein
MCFSGIQAIGAACSRSVHLGHFHLKILNWLRPIVSPSIMAVSTTRAEQELYNQNALVDLYATDS